MSPPTSKGSRRTIVGSNSIPTETKNRTANASRSGNVSCAALWLSCGFGQDHAGEKCAQGEGYVEELRRPESDTKRDREDSQPEQFARAGMGNVVKHPWDQAPPDYYHDREEGGQLHQGQPHAPERMRCKESEQAALAGSRPRRLTAAELGKKLAEAPVQGS